MVFGRFRFAVAFNINAHRFQDHRRAIFRLGSKLHHSCTPNTRYTSAGGMGRHVALDHIEAGALVTTSYLGPLHIQSTPRRRAHLHTGKLFMCMCPRCTGPDYNRQLPCPHCHPRDPNEPTLAADVAFELQPVHYAVCTMQPKAEVF